MRMPAIALAVLFDFAAAAHAQPPASHPLTPAEVTCEEQQMGRLVHRLSVAYNGSSLALWRTSAEGGAYSGLVATNDLHFTTVFGDRSRQESQFSFNLLLRPTGDFLDPRRPLLPQATLVRRDTASNLDVPIDGFGNLLLRMDLAAEVPNPDQPTIPLRISTRREAGQEKADGAGRGLAVDDLFTPCHGEVTEFDRRVFAILARTVRPTSCLGSAGECLSDRFKSVIYRGVEPLTYRVDVFLYSSHCEDTCTYGEGRIPILFRLVVDEAGRWLSGRAEVLPFCLVGEQLDCTVPLNPGISVYVLPPLRPGVDQQREDTFRRAARLEIDFAHSPENVLAAEVDWADLLRDTSWNGGLVPEP